LQKYNLFNLLLSQYNIFILIGDNIPDDLPKDTYIVSTDTWEKIRLFSPDTILTVLKIYKFFTKPEIL
jgi:hypothetical protein